MMTREEVHALKMGTFIEIEWRGAPTTVALLLKPMGPMPEPGTPYYEQLSCMHFDAKGRATHSDTAVHLTQVVRKISNLKAPIHKLLLKD